MTYSDISLDAATTALAMRLADVAFVRFKRDELDLYIFDALRTFNALTGIAQDSTVVAIPAGTVMQDMPTLLTGYRDYTILDIDLAALMSYHLFEPKSAAFAWFGSEMFTYAEISAAIEERRDQFLLETGCVVTRTAPYPAAPALINRSGEGEVELGTSIIDIRRAAWRDAETGKITPLWSSSNWALKGFSPRWNLQPDLPRVYAFNKRAPVVIQLAPPNGSSGTLDLCTINSGPAFDPAFSAPVHISVPDDSTPFIKWGALATLLSKDGPARDYARALYCERIYQRGVAASIGQDILIDARFGNQIAQLSSLASLDAAIPHWQNVSGQSKVLAIAGLNLFAFYPVPAADMGLQLTLIRNMPIPSQANRTTSYLQIGKEYLDVILGFAEHIAMFKVGGQEFAATTHFAESFFATAKAYSDREGTAIVYDADPRTATTPQTEAQPRRVQRETGGTLR